LLLLEAMAMITITLEGECWRDILDEMTIIQNAARASRIEAKPEWTNITKDERSCQDGPKKPSCPVCGKQVNEFDYNEHKWVAMDRKEYCSVKCSIAGRNMTERRAKCQGKPLADIFAYYGLGPEEGAELLERVR
jgi:hypothetical protein